MSQHNTTYQQESQRQKLLRLFEECHITSIASINDHNEAEASSAPFLYHQSSIWMLVSQLSSHTNNLITRQQCSLLINDNTYKDVFASTRVSLQCTVQVCEDSSCINTILDMMGDKLGATVAILRTLPDFTLLQLKPIHGRLISGFGKSFSITFPTLNVQHIDPSTTTST